MLRALLTAPPTRPRTAPALPRTFVCEPVPRSHFAQNKKTSRRAELARRRGLLRSCRSSRRWRRAPRTPCRALVALQRKFLLAFQIFVQPHGLILDHVVLHAQAPFQLGDQFAVRGADFLVHVNS